MTSHSDRLSLSRTSTRLRTAHSSRAGTDPDSFGNISDERGQIVSINGRLIPRPAGRTWSSCDRTPLVSNHWLGHSHQDPRMVHGFGLSLVAASVKELAAGTPIWTSLEDAILAESLFGIIRSGRTAKSSGGTFRRATL